MKRWNWSLGIYNSSISIFVNGAELFLTSEADIWRSMMKKWPEVKREPFSITWRR